MTTTIWIPPEALADFAERITAALREFAAAVAPQNPPDLGAGSPETAQNPVEVVPEGPERYAASTGRVCDREGCTSPTRHYHGRTTGAELRPVPAAPLYGPWSAEYLTDHGHPTQANNDDAERGKRGSGAGAAPRQGVRPSSPPAVTSGTRDGADEGPESVSQSRLTHDSSSDKSSFAGSGRDGTGTHREGTVTGRAGPRSGSGRAGGAHPPPVVDVVGAVAVEVGVMVSLAREWCAVVGERLCEYRWHEADRLRHPERKVELPAREFGRLCAWCWQRLNADVVDTPALVEHLLEFARPAVQATRYDSSGGGGGDPAERGVVPAAVDAISELVGQLAWLGLEVAKCRRLPGPSTSLLRMSQAHWRSDPESGEWWRSESMPVGVRSGREVEAARGLVRWLLPHLPWVAEQDWGPVFREEYGQIMATTRARWPERERAREIPDVQCPRCQALSLEYRPPLYERGQFQVVCMSEECGRLFTEEEWALLVGLLDLIERRAT